MKLEIVEFGIREAKARTDAVGERAEDVRPVFRVIREDWRQDQLEHFESRGGGQWKPNAPTTVARKRRQSIDVRVLHAKNVLKDSLTKPRARFAVQRVTTGELRFGTRAGVARIHEQGLGGLPRRKVVSIDRDDIRRARRKIELYIVDGETGQ